MCLPEPDRHLWSVILALLSLQFCSCESRWGNDYSVSLADELPCSLRASAPFVLTGEHTQRLGAPDLSLKCGDSEIALADTPLTKGSLTTKKYGVFRVGSDYRIFVTAKQLRALRTELLRPRATYGVVLLEPDLGRQWDLYEGGQVTEKLYAELERHSSAAPFPMTVYLMGEPYGTEKEPIPTDVRCEFRMKAIPEPLKAAVFFRPQELFEKWGRKSGAPQLSDGAYARLEQTDTPLSKAPDSSLILRSFSATGDANARSKGS